MGKTMGSYNIVDEPRLVKDIHQEYFKLINFYHNTKRPASFIRYYNLATDISPVDSNTQITYDRYTKTKAHWDLYELTPAFNIAPIQNAPGSAQDLKGQMIEGSTSITVYTIQNPRIDDLISFYDPIKSEEVFRVSNLRLQLNSAYSDPPVKWFELDLETAPIKHENLDKLQKRNHYIYDVATEQNYNYPDYKKHLAKLDLIKTLLEEFKSFYSPELDLYHYKGKIPRITNELIFHLKTKYNDKFNRVFEGYYSPFGFWDRLNILSLDINELNMTPMSFYDVFNNTTKMWESYQWLNDDILNQIGLDRLFLLTQQLKNII